VPGSCEKIAGYLIFIKRRRAPDRAARVSKRMSSSLVGELSTDLRRSVIWTYGGKNSNIRLLTRAALLFGRIQKSCQKNKKFQRSTANGIRVHVEPAQALPFSIQFVFQADSAFLLVLFVSFVAEFFPQRPNRSGGKSLFGSSRDL
jgi:hypothetical protein